MEKVKLPREVAEAIEGIRSSGSTMWTSQIPIDLLSRDFLDDASGEWSEVDTINSYLKKSIENTATYFWAVKYGYEVEQTPEDRVVKMFQNAIDEGNALGDHPQANWWDGRRMGIIDTLNALNIKIQGVNE